MPVPPTAAARSSVTPTPTLAAPPTRPAPRAHRRTDAPPADTGAGAGAGGRRGAGEQAAGDVVRWAVFCCALVPVVLVVYGTSLAGAAGAALGLVSVTAACRLLLRRSERGLRAETPHGGHRR
ncbi:hypothetical protein GCM10010497_43150 [Streptomyces cinereoruber]|uniref:Uncharacterized protein n=1 Tax=Streptomyces cinereoruber TaxID=67260 RepID=A0AAV4KL63_9ACTN|nr:hypothetical protein C5L38_21840 [Streptomyces sp. WAC00288]MBB4156471.1 hypothetical protein [Streptomyces cinereoruber]PVC70612.1 hypothetical protein DBP18_19735 [Streptomyces sp. CS081A]MBY8815688.1 hypothetical protein [Streptomyces cinereoruber]NIH61456.1 hypothetical protein [Streptomyces cinereoruber]